MVHTACPGLCSVSWNVFMLGAFFSACSLGFLRNKLIKKNFERNFLFLVQVLTKKIVSQLKVSSIKSVNKSKHFNFAETAFLLGKECECFNVWSFGEVMYRIPPCCTLRQRRKGCSTGLFLGAWEPARAHTEFRIQVGLLPPPPHSTDILQLGPFFLLQDLQYCCYNILKISWANVTYILTLEHKYVVHPFFV